MSPPRDPDAQSDAAMEQAADWFLRLTSGEISENDPGLLAWRAQSPENAEAWLRAQVAWGLLGEHARSPELTRARSDALGRVTAAAARRWRALPHPLASGVFKALRSPVRAAAALAVLGAIGAGVWLAGPGRPSPAPARLVYETGLAETRLVVLPDNSRVTLDAATRLTAAYTPEARQIDLLSGQAFFDVAKDPGRPFRVTAGDQTVVAVGTAFNVEYVDSAIVVTLVEGEVVVTEGPPVAPAPAADDRADPAAPVNSVKLVAGQQLVAPRDAEAEITASPNLDKSTSWRRGRIIFEEDTLEAAVERVNRYSRIRIVIADPALRDLRIGGVFNAGDTEAFLDAVEAAFPVEARRMTASEIELHAAGE